MAADEQTWTTDHNSVFFLTGHRETHLPSIIHSIQKLPCMQDRPLEFTYIGTASPHECCALPVIKSPSQLLVELYRRCKPFGAGGNTILSVEAQMAILQLCLAEHNKQKYDVYDTDASEVLQKLKQLNDQKLSTTFTDDVQLQDSSQSEGSSLLAEPVRCLYEAFLKSCNMVDIMDVYQEVKTLIETDEDCFKSFRAKHGLIVVQWPHEVLERNILKLLCGQPGTITEINVDILSDTLGEVNDDNIKLHVTQRDWDTLQDMEESCSASSPKMPRSPVSTTEVLVHQVFLSFLGLLVNSRDELSVARCLSYSQTGLDHKGFTALKNLAKHKNMSMYQTAVSYITKLRLGGRSYAPGNEGAFLGDNVKSLSEFVTNVQKLQVLLEEVPDTRLSIIKILVSIKALLCKCRGSVFKPAAVEKVCQTFKSKFDKLLTTYNQSSQASPPKTANQGGSVLGRKTLKVIQMFLDQETTRPSSHSAVTMLSDCILTQATPVRMPSLLAQFRSPEVIYHESPENQALRDRIVVPNQELKQVKCFGNQSDMAWAEPTERNPLQDKDMNQINQPETRDQYIKLWAVTPPEKHRQAKVITHEFHSPTSPTTLQQRPRQRSPSVTDHTPKRPKGCGRKTTEASMDKENLCTEHTKKKGGVVKRRVKRVLMEDTGSSQPNKRAKKNNGGVKKKQMTLVKGQKTLNQFFRV